MTGVVHRRAREVHQAADERGESLVELLLAVAILGIAIVAILAGMATAITASDANRKQARVETLLRNYAEAITNPAVAYVECATTGSYPASPPGFTLPPNFTLTVTQVRYWDGANPAAFGGTCGSPDRGIQHLTVRVRSTDDLAGQTLGFVKRRPGTAP